MPKRHLTLTKILLLVITCSYSQSDPTLGAQLLKEAIDAKEVKGISAGVAVDGEIKWIGRMGIANNDGAPFNENSVNRTASVSKPMTAIAIMQLHEKGTIDIENPIGSYLPEHKNGKYASITVRHLLNHASGIGAYASNKERQNKKEYATLAEAVALFKDRDLQFEPGTDFGYTSYGYSLLGLIIEKVSGITYEDYLQQNIWKVAGMTNTSVERAGKSYAGKSDLYHMSKPGKIKEASPTNLSDRIPGGGIQSTVADLLKFGDALVRGKLVSDTSLKMMMTNSGLKKEGSGYGLGWYLYGNNPKYGEVIGHTGGQTGVSAMFMVMPEVKATVVVLSNTSGALQRVSGVAVKLFALAPELKP